MRDDQCCPQCPCNAGEKMYQVFGGNSRMIYKAQEDLDCCCRQWCCICRRDFELRLVDAASGGDAYRLDHKRMCCSWFHCCACCRHRMSMHTPDGRQIGHMESDCRICACFPKFSVYEATSEANPIFTLDKQVSLCAQCCGNCSFCCCRCEVPAGYVISGQGSKGELYKSVDDRPKTGRDDTFMLTFPVGTSQDHRALLLAATMLVDYTLYDDKPTPQKME